MWKIDRKLIARIACSYACYDILLGRDFDNSLKVENRNRPIVEIDPLSRLTIKIILYEPSLLDHGDSFPQPISQYHNPLVGLPPYRSMDDNSMDFETANVAYIDPTMPWTVKLFEHMFINIRRDPFVVLMLEYVLLLHGRNKATVPPALLHGPESTTITETFQSWHRYWMIDARWSWSRYFISALPKPMNARCHIICSSFVVILLLLVLVSMVDLIALGTWYLYCPFPEPLGLVKWFDFWNNDHHQQTVWFVWGFLLFWSGMLRMSYPAYWLLGKYFIAYYSLRSWVSSELCHCYFFFGIFVDHLNHPFIFIIGITLRSRRKSLNMMVLELLTLFVSTMGGGLLLRWSTLRLLSKNLPENNIITNPKRWRARVREVYVDLKNWIL